VEVLANRKKSEPEQARTPGPVAVEPAPGQSAPAKPPKKIEPPDPPLTEKQKAAAADAIKALGRIDAAVEVGVTYQQYGQLVIDAKAVVNETARVLPQGKMLTNLTETMDAYKDAGTIWNRKIRYPNLGLSKESYGELIDRYKVPVSTVDFLGKPREEADPDLAMQVIWGVGAEKLAKARSLL
jgi:hypothetical protein